MTKKKTKIVFIYQEIFLGGDKAIDFIKKTFILNKLYISWEQYLVFYEKK